jgi:cbb3-type cytochrome oxidase subunit 3
MKKNNYYFYIITAVFLVSNFWFFLNANLTLADDPKSLFNRSLDATAEATGHKSLTGFNDPALTIGTFIKFFISFLGVIFLILMIYGGYLWMLARGNEQEVEKAKTIIQNALIGLIIVFMAYGITYFANSIFIFATN